MDAPVFENNQTPLGNFQIKYKEFYNLNDYYLKISITAKGEISFIIYNMKLLDGIKYYINLNLNEFQKLNKLFKVYDNVEEIYENIMNIIENNNYKINNQKNNMILLLYLFDISQKRNEIQLILNKYDANNEYSRILSKELIKLKEENSNIIKELKELKNIIYEKLNAIKTNEIIIKENIKKEIPKNNVKNNNENINKKSPKKDIQKKEANNDQIKLKNKSESCKDINMSIDNNYNNLNEEEKIKQFNKIFNTYIYKSTNQLNLRRKDLNDIKIQYLFIIDFIQLTSLDLCGNKITDINFLKKGNFNKLEKLE